MAKLISAEAKDFYECLHVNTYCGQSNPGCVDSYRLKLYEIRSCSASTKHFERLKPVVDILGC